MNHMSDLFPVVFRSVVVEVTRKCGMMEAPLPHSNRQLQLAIQRAEKSEKNSGNRP
jgi:hypothetical protein